MICAEVIPFANEILSHVSPDLTLYKLSQLVNIPYWTGLGVTILFLGFVVLGTTEVGVWPIMLTQA